MGFKVGVSTGLYYVARGFELATVIKKIGYGLTRGTSVIEISGDMPHEIDFTEGIEARHLADKQGVELLFHGSLTVPMCIPEQVEWRDAHKHIQMSIRSAVNAGCKYVLFHACLNFWLEMITFAAHRLEVTMCDHLGRFVSEILYENKRLREWFIKKMRTFEIPYPHVIMIEEEMYRASHRAWEEAMLWSRRGEEERVREEVRKAGLPTTPEELARLTPDERRNVERKIREIETKVRSEVAEEAGKMQAQLTMKYEDDIIREKMSSPDPKKRMWRITVHGRYSDMNKIMANYLFFRKDPIWLEMAKMYKEAMDRYGLDYSDDEWFDKAWEKAEKANDVEFKEFYYAVVGAKFLEGHMKAALEWIEKEFILKELKDKPDLVKIAKNLHITIETPDARDARYAGRYLLWHPKQIYAAVKTIRKTLKTDRIWMTPDFEHLATQGVDPLTVMKEEVVKIAPDFGSYVLSVHSNPPNPLHSHYPIELGDVTVYELLLLCRKTGMGKKNEVYLIFERGSEEPREMLPFRQAVDALKLMAKFLEKDTEVEKLPLEFHGLELTAFDIKRQEEIMLDHRFEPLKDLFEIPEEEWGLLSQAATKKGKKEIFKKEELR